VARFNAQVLPRYAADSVWESQVPAAALGRSRPDTLASEGNGRDTFFPHTFAREGRPGQYWIWFERTPMLDSLTLDFAKTTVGALGLGRDATPDFLNVSLSQTDRVGHDYGPLSREELDNLLRLDRALGDFFAYLDATVGAGRWTVALSADHGSPVSPEDLPVAGEDYTGHRVTPDEAARMDSIRARADRAASDPATPGRVVAELKRLPFVADAWTHADLERGVLPDSFAVLARRSIYPGRAGGEFSQQGVEVRFVPGFIVRPRGIDHGAPYWYDRHVPMIFMGPGIAPGKDPSRVATVDFAPTLARLLGVPAPRDLDGKALAGVVRR
jgi:predicted AlkP superfamily pyrophosphatase or phosphodiesterase